MWIDHDITIRQQDHYRHKDPKRYGRKGVPGKTHHQWHGEVDADACCYVEIALGFDLQDQILGCIGWVNPESNTEDFSIPAFMQWVEECPLFLCI
jgi:hypothetical protein